MEIKYIVNGKEFTNEKEARKYEKTLLVQNAKYSIGETVYFPMNSGKLAKAVVRSIEEQFGHVCYHFENIDTGKYEECIYRTPEDYVNYILENIVII